MAVTNGLQDAAGGASAGAAIGSVVPGVGTAIGAGVGALGGLLGGLFGSSDNGAAGQLLQQTLDGYKQLGVPDQQAMTLALQKFQSAGQLTPAMQTAISQKQSALTGANTADQQDIQAQRAAIASLKNTADQGGMTLEDRANEANVLNAANQNNKSQQDAILQNMAQRGQAGSGNALAAQLLASQGGANSTNASEQAVAADAQKRAMDAVMRGGQLSGQLQQNQFNQAATVGTAQDAINSFNARNAQNVQGSNVAAQNAAQAANLANAQSISNANTTLANQQQQYNKGLQQTIFNDNLAKLQGQGNAANKVASQINTQNTKLELAMP